MSNTKKMFVELVTFLNNNKDKKVVDVWSQIEELTMSKKQEETILYDKDGKVTHIYCYYHKQWEDVTSVDYGKKASSKSGLNTMCKIGTNLWTKQQSNASKAKEEVLTGVQNGSIKPIDIKTRLDEVEATRNSIDKTNMPKGTKDLPKIIEIPKLKK